MQTTMDKCDKLTKAADKATKQAKSLKAQGKKSQSAKQALKAKNLKKQAKQAKEAKDPQRDFEEIGMFGTFPMIGMAKKDGPIRNIADLVAAYGSPLILFSERLLRERMRELRDQMATRIPRFTIGWSYKTNYLGAVCRVLHQEGAWAEVVSGLEMQMALRLGMPGHQILFNGPAKTEAELEMAFTTGAHVQMDHLDEVALAEKVAERLGIRPTVGIRVNMTELPTQSWDRFGFNQENGSALEAARRIVRRGVLEINSLHIHVGTFVQEADAYRLAAKGIAMLAARLRDESHVSIDTIDMGGGFASRNTLQSQYLPGEQATPSFSQYVEKIAAAPLRHLIRDPE